MRSDTELLEDFARLGSQSSFSELVGRHVSLVHGAALRILNGDAHLAEDARLDISSLKHFRAWTERFRNESPFLADVHPYSIDPHSSGEL